MAMLQVTKRLNRIFESVLGCTIEFQAVEDIVVENWVASDLLDLKGDVSLSPKFIESTVSSSYGFPVRKGGIFLGLAIVAGFKDARPQRLLLLAELMTMVLDYSLRAGDRAERLRLIEERMALLDEASNVIQLRPARFGRVLELTDIPAESAPIASPLITSPLLLVTTAAFPLNRIAIEIHEMSKRWALVNNGDLPAEIFESRESLQQLGGLTLFIRDIATLTTSQQLKLGEYLALAPSEDSPHIIAGANEPVEDLIHGGRLLPHLAGLFTVSVLQASNKSADQITRELVSASLQQILAQTRAASRHSHQVGDNFIPFNAQYFNPDDSSSFH